MSMYYTTHRLNNAGAIVESRVVTSADDVRAFELARAAVIHDRQQMLSEVCMPGTTRMEDAA